MQPEEDLLEVDKEKLFTVDDVCTILGVTRETHWIRVIHEVTRDAPPFAMFRVQALKRTGCQHKCPPKDDDLRDEVLRLNAVCTELANSECTQLLRIGIPVTHEDCPVCKRRGFTKGIACEECHGLGRRKIITR